MSAAIHPEPSYNFNAKAYEPNQKLQEELNFFTIQQKKIQQEHDEILKKNSALLAELNEYKTKLNQKDIVGEQKDQLINQLKAKITDQNLASSALNAQIDKQTEEINKLKPEIQIKDNTITDSLETIRRLTAVNQALRESLAASQALMKVDAEFLIVGLATEGAGIGLGITVGILSGGVGWGILAGIGLCYAVMGSYIAIKAMINK